MIVPWQVTDLLGPEIRTSRFGRQALDSTAWLRLCLGEGATQTGAAAAEQAPDRDPA